MGYEKDVLKTSLRALSEWVSESERKGLDGTDLVTMLLSETVRNYKRHYANETDHHLVAWLKSTFNYKKESDDEEDDEGWGAN